MHYKEGPCRPQSPLLHVDIERRLEVPAETRGHPGPGLFAPLTLMQTNGVNNDAFLHRLFHLINLV